MPTLAQLLTLSEQALWDLGWGYRAPRLYKLARDLEERGGEGYLDGIVELDEEAARAALTCLTGVGRKVAKVA